MLMQIMLLLLLLLLRSAVAGWLKRIRILAACSALAGLKWLPGQGRKEGNMIAICQTVV